MWWGRSARGWMQIAGGSSASSQCVCEEPWARGLGPADDGGVPSAVVFSVWDSHPGHLASLWPSEALYPKSLVSLENGLEPRRG